MTHRLTREAVRAEIEALSRDALLRIVTETGVEVADLSLVCRPRGTNEICDDVGAITNGESSVLRSGAHGIGTRRQLAQMWLILSTVHTSLSSDSKMTQRT